MGLPRISVLKQILSKSTPITQSFKHYPVPKQPHLSYHYNFITTRDYSLQRAYEDGLHSKITLFVAGSPNSSVAPFLDRWVEEGNKVREVELQRIIRTLRSKKRYARALEVSEWMTSKSFCNSLPGDLAVQLDLIGKVRGIDVAEKYFNEMNNQSQQIWGALLNCYVREGLVDKSLSHLKKMKEMGFARNPLTYNDIMCLYMNTDQVEKIPEVLSEMEKNGVFPDNFSYRICIKSYGLRSDFQSMEKLLKEMESQPRISMDWSTYTTVASYYIQGGLTEKAIYYLQKAEDRVQKDAVGYNNLITMYASLGNVFKVMKLWQKQKDTGKRQINIDYMTMMGSLVKLGELEKAEKIFKAWESSGNLYDFRVPNVLLIGYTQRGMVEKAEEMLEGIVSKGKTPIPNSWSIMTAGYINARKMEKALESMKRALELEPQNKGWVPKPTLVSSLLKWLGDNGDIKEVEAFVKLLGRVVPMDREMYATLLVANIRHGNEVNGVLQRMKDDNIDVDEETKKILS